MGYFYGSFFYFFIIFDWNNVNVWFEFDFREEVFLFKYWDEFFDVNGKIGCGGWFFVKNFDEVVVVVVVIDGVYFEVVGGYCFEDDVGVVVEIVGYVEVYFYLFGDIVGIEKVNEFVEFFYFGFCFFVCEEFFSFWKDFIGEIFNFD